MSDLAIHVQDVSLTLQTNVGPVSILKNINLQVKKGESIGLVGPSGSGKSSLLMLLGGLEKATKGQVQVLKKSFGSMGEDALAKFRRMHMGIIFQSFQVCGLQVFKLPAERFRSIAIYVENNRLVYL